MSLTLWASTVIGVISGISIVLVGVLNFCFYALRVKKTHLEIKKLKPDDKKPSIYIPTPEEIVKFKKLDSQYRNSIVLLIVLLSLGFVSLLNEKFRYDRLSTIQTEWESQFGELRQNIDASEEEFNNRLDYERDQRRESESRNKNLVLENERLVKEKEQIDRIVTSLQQAEIEYKAAVAAERKRNSDLEESIAKQLATQTVNLRSENERKFLRLHGVGEILGKKWNIGECQSSMEAKRAYFQDGFFTWEMKALTPLMISNIGIRTYDFSGDSKLHDPVSVQVCIIEWPYNPRPKFDLEARTNQDRYKNIGLGAFWVELAQYRCCRSRRSFQDTVQHRG